MSDLGGSRFVLTSRSFLQLRKCESVVVSSTLSFPGFLPAVCRCPAEALISYLFDRSHSWYAGFLKIFILVQGFSVVISKLTAYSW